MKYWKKDILESAISEVRNEFPSIGEVLISERDQYLAYKIKEAPGSKVVAVVGGAHVPGVKEEIYKNTGYRQNHDGIQRQSGI